LRIITALVRISVCFVISILPVVFDKLLDFTDVGRVDDDIPPVHPKDLAVLRPPIPLTGGDELLVVQRLAELAAACGGMLKVKLMHEVSLRRRHIHRDQEPHLSLLTTVPSIFFFHREFLLPGRGFFDFLAPMWR
jgi:hypothetical protein